MKFDGFRYRLDKGSKKFPCPECQKRTLVRYVDQETGEYLPDHYGRCDREINCNYRLNPYKDGFNQKYEDCKTDQIPRIRRNIEKKENSLNTHCIEFNPIPIQILMKTLRLEGYDQNVFIQNLLHNVSYPFDSKDIEKVISQYYLGTICNGYRTGAITFPFIDIQGQVKAIQVKQFDQNNHTTGTDFLHSIIEKHHRKKNEKLPHWLRSYLNNEKKITCLFGESLLNKYPVNRIALVEAPKTAIYSTLYFGFPDNPANFLWLAVYSLSSLTFDKCKVLKGRKVYLFPDLSKNSYAFDLWNKKAIEYRQKIPGTQIKVSDLLEVNGEEKEKSEGYDLADYLIKLDWRKFRPENNKQESNKYQTEQTILIPESEIIPDLKSENGEKSEATKTNQNFDSVAAYLDKDERLYIETPLGKTFTVYPSIEHYNQRKCIPLFIDKNQIDLIFMKEVRINLNTLFIENQS